MKAVKKLLKVSTARNIGPLLAISDRTIFTCGMLQKRLKECVGRLGLQKAHYSSCSLRHGAVVWAERNNIPDSLIQIYGNWSSNAFQWKLE